MLNNYYRVHEKRRREESTEIEEGVVWVEANSSNKYE